MTDERVPVTVVTGYLGAGKSTLLNHVLKGSNGKRYAVIVNEFGDVGVDGDLIETGEEELIELSSGCLCCVVRGDLIRTLKRLLKRGPRLDGILIETTGVANPSPVIQTFTADQVLGALSRLDAVVTVVDAAHIRRRLDDSPDAADQVALASVVVLNKMADAVDVDAIEAALRALNPHAPFYRTNRGQIDPSKILDTTSFSLDRVSSDLAHAHDHHHNDHVAENGIACVSITLDEPLDGAAVEVWLERLLMLRGENILRLKGVLNVVGDAARVVVQAVHMMYEGGHGAPWSGTKRQSKIVVIGRDLDPAEIREGFEACRAKVTA